MKILYIPPLGGGIRDLYEAGQHRRLLEDYFTSYQREFDEVLVLSFFKEKLEDYEDAKIPPGVTLLANTMGLHRYLYALLAPWLHRKKLRGVRVMRVSQATGALPAFFMRLFLKIPAVITYGYDYVLFAGTRGKIATWLARLHESIGRRTADFWITTTQELVALLQDRHQVDRDRIYLIPNGVNLNQFQEREHDEDEDLRSLIFVGRLETQKNLFFLFDCVSATAERFQTRLRLVVVGEGKLREALATHKISNLLKLELVGKVEQSRLTGFFRDSQLFVTASHFEGHPKAVIEAMASGLPVLGLDSPGVAPLLRAASQPVFADVEGFVAHFKRLLDSRVRIEAATRAAKLARRDFDLEKNIMLETELLVRVARARQKDHARNFS